MTARTQPDGNFYDHVEHWAAKSGSHAARRQIWSSLQERIHRASERATSVVPGVDANEVEDVVRRRLGIDGLDAESFFSSGHADELFDIDDPETEGTVAGFIEECARGAVNDIWSEHNPYRESWTGRLRRRVARLLRSLS